MNAIKFLLVRLLTLLIGGALAATGSYVVSLGFSMPNSSAAEICFGCGTLVAIIGLVAISKSINMKHQPQGEKK